MALWVRFETAGSTVFGTVNGEMIADHEGDMFDNPRPSGRQTPVGSVTLRTPCDPTKMVCLWNNSRTLAAALRLKAPVEPLYFLKTTTAFHAANHLIPRPKGYSGRVMFEGELGVVISKRCKSVPESDAPKYIFGYTCVNDVTAIDLLNKEPSFPQWTRAKNFDGFGVFGPVISTGIDPRQLRIRAIRSGQERQNYSVSDMFFDPYRLVSLISKDMTLLPGDIISCGTSAGSGSMNPGTIIDIVIDRIGTLSNTME